MLSFPVLSLTVSLGSKLVLKFILVSTLLLLFPVLLVSKLTSLALVLFCGLVVLRPKFGGAEPLFSGPEGLIELAISTVFSTTFSQPL